VHAGDDHVRHAQSKLLRCWSRIPSSEDVASTPVRIRKRWTFSAFKMSTNSKLPRKRIGRKNRSRILRRGRMGDGERLFVGPR